MGGKSLSKVKPSNQRKKEAVRVLCQSMCFTNNNNSKANHY